MKYKSLPKNSDIDAEMALLQSASLLDIAAETAERMNDVDGLLNTAALWMKFGDQIYGFAEKVGEDKSADIMKMSESRLKLGFQTSEEHLGEEID